jgi:cell shape-determining protein MreD
MSVCFYLLTGIVLILLQTTLLPELVGSRAFYDLLTPMVIHISVYRPLREGAGLILLLGMAMDGLSGGPPGLYISLYVGLYVAMRYLKQFLHVGNLILLSLVAIVSVGLESLAFFGLIGIESPVSQIWLVAVHTFLRQMAFAVFTTPVILIGLRLGQVRVNRLVKALFSENGAG